VTHVKAIIPFAACIAGALLASTASQAQDAQHTCGSVTFLQKRIVERADQGIEPLRDFVWSRRGTYGIGMEDVKTGLDTWRANVSCQKEVAAAAAAATVAKEETHDDTAPSPQVAAAGR
jgi:hypothetical protein